MLKVFSSNTWRTTTFMSATSFGSRRSRSLRVCSSRARDWPAPRRQAQLFGQARRATIRSLCHHCNRRRSPRLSAGSTARQSSRQVIRASFLPPGAALVRAAVAGCSGRAPGVRSLERFQEDEAPTIAIGAEVSHRDASASRRATRSNVSSVVFRKRCARATEEPDEHAPQVFVAFAARPRSLSR